jgi:hypothetical protein
MIKNYFIILISICTFTTLKAQDWSLELKSTVELRTFKLTNKAEISEQKLAGATIALFKGASLVNQVQSDGNGDFVINVPANGEFILTVSYSGCNQKKFAISTLNVPEEVAKDKFRPTFSIAGVIMAKAFQTIDYFILKQPLVKIIYTSNGKKFDDDEEHTEQMLVGLSRIRDTENALIENFTTTNNTGDIALSKGDCPLAKASYEKAMTIITGEPYPGIQLPKVGDCLKAKEVAAKKAEDEVSAKVAAAKLAADKAEADRLVKEKSIIEKAEADRLAKEKAEADKMQSAKLAADKAEADRLAKEKSIAEKAETDRLTKEKAEADKTQSAKLAAEKAENDRLSKEKGIAEKAEADRLAKEKAGADKAQSAKLAADKAEADRLVKEKSIAEKAESDRLAKEKAGADKAQSAKLETEKATADKLAKEKNAAEKTESERLAKEKAVTEKQKVEKSTAEKKQPESVSEKATEPAKKETTGGITPTGTGSEPSKTGVGSANAKYSIPQALGSDKYKLTIKRADELFKMKRYAEAKTSYEEALTQKPNDPYATNKLVEAEKLIKK